MESQPHIESELATSTEATQHGTKEEKFNLRLLKSTLEKIGGIAGGARKRLHKPFLIAIVQGILTSLIFYDWFVGEWTFLIVLLALSFIPALAVSFVRARLHAVENIHQHVETLEQSSKAIEEQLRQQGITKDLKEFVNEKQDATLRQRIKLLIGIAPTLYKARESIKELASPEIFLTIMSVSNPGFGLVTAISLGLVIVWCFGLVLLGISWLII